jgi:ABC-type lipoprotein export system ATPase subunit
MVMVTHSRSLAARLPRTIEIRDGRIFSDQRITSQFKPLNAIPQLS